MWNFAIIIGELTARFVYILLPVCLHWSAVCLHLSFVYFCLKLFLYTLSEVSLHCSAVCLHFSVIFIYIFKNCLLILSAVYTTYQLFAYTYHLFVYIYLLFVCIHQVFFYTFFAAYIEFSDLLHTAPMMGLERIKSKVKVTDCRKRLHQLSDSVKVKKRTNKTFTWLNKNYFQLLKERKIKCTLLSSIWRETFYFWKIWFEKIILYTGCPTWIGYILKC